MKKISLIIITVIAAACTQPATPPAATTPPPAQDQGKAQDNGSGVTATTPILSLIVDNTINAAAKATWCLKDGSAPFTKIAIQDVSVTAPIENQSAPLPGGTTAKDTLMAQAPGTATVSGGSGDSFQIKWKSVGITGTADLALQGDALIFSDENGKASFTHCQ